MSPKSVIPILIITAALVGLIYWFSNKNQKNSTLPDNGGAGNETGTPENDNATSTSDTVSDGTIMYSRPEDFGLAVIKEQILVDFFIPPCEEGFDYCLYYEGNAYQGTNFDSAGLSIRTRVDLTTQTGCLTTPPSGYSDLTPKSMVREKYSMGLFAPLGDAAAGHYSNGEQYRLFTRGMCYQIDARIGEAQFANYPEGSIQEFTLEQRQEMFNKLRSIIESITLVGSGEKLTLPE